MIKLILTQWSPLVRDIGHEKDKAFPEIFLNITEG
jgi:hypothetical protein